MDTNNMDTNMPNQTDAAEEMGQGEGDQDVKKIEELLQQAYDMCDQAGKTDVCKIIKKAMDMLEGGEDMPAVSGKSDYMDKFMSDNTNK